MDELVSSHPQFLRTSDLAKAVGIHPNTVRRYVDWGLVPPVERSPAGYRRFTQKHLDCLRLAQIDGFIAVELGQHARQALVTPHPDEDVYMASDHWLSTLEWDEQKARAIIAMVEGVIGASSLVE